MQLIQQLQNFYVKEESQKMRFKKKKIALNSLVTLFISLVKIVGRRKRGNRPWMFPLISHWSLVSAGGGDGKCGISFDKAKQFQGLLFSQITVVHHAAPFPLPSVQLCDVNISFACLLSHTLGPYRTLG